MFVYHVDETIDGNEDENHPFIKLLEADGRGHLHDGANRGDAGDPYPGSSKNVALTNASNPSAKSYGGVDTCVTITNISASGAGIKVRIGVKCAEGPAPKPASSRKSHAGGARRTSGKETERKKARVKAGARKSVRAGRRGRRR